MDTKVFKEFIKDFIAEASETLACLDQDFIELEKNPDDRDRLESIYGGIHTIKGSAGFFAFNNLEGVAHAGEDLLQSLMEGKVEITSAVISGLLAMVDAIRNMLDLADQDENDGDNSYPELKKVLVALQRGETPPIDKASLGAVGRNLEASGELVDEECTFEHAGAEFALEPEVEEELEPNPRAEVSEPAPSKATATTSKEEEPAPKPQKSTVPSADASTEPPPAEGEEIDDLEETGGDTEEASAVENNARTARRSRATREGGAARSSSASTIRVSVELLDRLMGLVGELVLSRNQVTQYGAMLGDRASAASFQQLDLITTELQEAVMKTRMQPIANIFSKFPRIVRDLALGCGKKVELVMEGEETELDKSLLEAVSAPLTHIIRNAVDHGIELPAKRLDSGKSDTGLLRLRAFHESGHVNIEISDDGNGIDLSKVRSKAIKQGIVSKAEAERMSEDELVRLVFLPGFSTAATVSNISGRGVGMDVVRSQIDQIGGSVDIQTVRGEGTTLKIKFPLTLAIIPALIVTSGKDRYAIAQVNLREAVHLKAGDANKLIERVHNVPVYRLRGRLLPLVDLSRELGGKAVNMDSSHGVNLVVLSIDGQEFGLVVDGIGDTFEIVVKPISRMVKGQACFSGATIMDDGRPALILDVLGVARRARVLAVDLEKSGFVSHKEEALLDEDKEAVLLFEGAGGARMGMALQKVGRLEIFRRSKVEDAGGRKVIQYRDTILPLVDVFALLGAQGALDRPTDLLHVVVYDYDGQKVGLLVGTIVDIVEERVDVKGRSSRNGVVGTAVIRERVTELLDPDVLLQMTDLGLEDARSVTLFGAKRHG